ncbi:Fur family transcriptional regulator [Miniphocaeibacter halophilus]|uniref:Transcriptional repressor n=1 Tax=Miniphocaeibacter halophilus TaxID=2931922 RepID=A0AC61MSL2_9FIRM|nr:Fur family transcriptional regulator [Miniphocaeibacter halophilus]QQK07590.1 transcriptional repressor [Miniphocaeibacter halophilus]
MDLNNLKTILTENGYKVTKQREVIFQALLENNESHLSPEELHEIVSKIDKDIGIATVYRTLLLFEELNIVYKLDFDDNRYRYELASEGEKHQHHHLICTNCSKVEEVKYDLLENIEEDIEKTYKFKIQNHVLKFFGLCSECQSKEIEQGDLNGTKKTK